MYGIIKIEGLRVQCIIGVKPLERKVPQQITLDIEMKAEIFEAAQTDSIIDTVDYEKVANSLQELADQRNYHLLETFAFEALNEVLSNFPIVWAKISISKKQALQSADRTLVVLEKSKE